MDVKVKEDEKLDKYLDLARKLKKLEDMKVTVMSIVVDAFRTVSKNLKKLKMGGRIDIIETTVFLKSVRILRRVLETWGDLWSLRLQWKTSS